MFTQSNINIEDLPASELSDVANNIFSQPPQEPCTIVLQMYEEGHEGIERLKIQGEFEKDKLELEFMRTLMFEGIKVLWGVKTIKFEDITYDQFNIIKKYMMSVGYEPIFIRIWEIEETVGVDSSEKRSLKTLKLYFKNLWKERGTIPIPEPQHLD